MDNLAKHAQEAIGAGAANAADKKGTFAVKVCDRPRAAFRLRAELRNLGPTFPRSEPPSRARSLGAEHAQNSLSGATVHRFRSVLVREWVQSCRWLQAQPRGCSLLLCVVSPGANAASSYTPGEC